jgi:hypothetical protein
MLVAGSHGVRLVMMMQFIMDNRPSCLLAWQRDGVIVSD